MNLDIRYPIGAMFAVMGIILSVFGLVSDPKIYHRSLGDNVNLYWGSFLVLFGVVMLGLAWFHSQRSDRS